MSRDSQRRDNPIDASAAPQGDATMGAGVAHLLQQRSDPVDAQTVTRCLKAWNEGSGTSIEILIPRVYGEMRRIAQRLMVGESGTLQPTALVHEAYLRLLDQKKIQWQDRGHFFAVCARIMRHIIVDHARARSAWKRGGRDQKVPLDEALDAFEDRCDAYIALDDALEDLERTEPRRAAILELRVFGGLTQEETAEVLGISRPTVVRQYKLTKAWLHHYFETKE